jgi:cytochrome c oxidase subunit 2
MPTLVGRKRLVVVLLVLLVPAALALAGTALAGNAGFGPEAPRSPNAHSITKAYWFIFAFTATIFVLVEGALVLFLFRYRSRGRPRTVEGDQVHGHHRLELIWTVVPVLILVAIATFVFTQLPGISNVPAAANRIDVQVIGHQYYWQFRYPGGQTSIGAMHVPAGRVVYLSIDSPDVNHSWWIPQLGGKTDAIPGRTNHTWLQAEPGNYRGQCAELCGLYHARMLAKVIATDDAGYEQFLAQAPKNLGHNEFTGVCTQCHGIGGTGGYGPPLKGNPLVSQPSAIENIVRNGRTGPQGTMPAVGKGWTDKEMDALTAYLKKNLGSTSGG